jgi:predicted ribosome quality control (RQC) complex YloA/Tae2 family protein
MTNVLGTLDGLVDPRRDLETAAREHSQLRTEIERWQVEEQVSETIRAGRIEELTPALREAEARAYDAAERAHVAAQSALEVVKEGASVALTPQEFDKLPESRRAQIREDCAELSPPELLRQVRDAINSGDVVGQKMYLRYARGRTTADDEQRLSPAFRDAERSLQAALNEVERKLRASDPNAERLAQRAHELIGRAASAKSSTLRYWDELAGRAGVVLPEDFASKGRSTFR